MVKINFQNNVTKANADTFNTMQNNIENAINDMAVSVDSTISTSSTNPIENQAITNYVDTEIQSVENYADEKCSYSTTEKRIGKWIDGKPLYRCVIEFTTSSSGNININLTSLHIKKLTKIDGVVGNDNDAKPINFYYEGNYISPRYSNNIMYIANSSVYGNTQAYLFIEYTKTSDYS